MNKDLYIELLEKEIWNTCAGRESAKPLPDWDPQLLRQEIQDLKLENDRLKKREEIMMQFIKSIECSDRNCIRCALHTENGVCKWTLFPYRVKLVNELIQRLEEL